MHYLAPPKPPSDDKRWKMVTATMRRHGHRPDALIETLHTVQETFGYLGTEALHYVAASLRVPLSRVYGVATFYHFFSLEPPGDHTCILCTGQPATSKAYQESSMPFEPSSTSESGRQPTTDPCHSAAPVVSEPVGRLRWR